MLLVCVCGRSSASTGCWTVATSSAGFSEPTGTPVVSMGGPERVGTQVCGAPLDGVATVDTRLWRPAAWFTGWMVAVDGSVRVVDR